MHSQLFHLLFADNAGDDILAVAVSQLARLRGEISGVTDIRRHIAEIFCCFNPGGNRQTVLDRALTAGQFTAGRHVEHHFTQRTTRFALIRFQLIETVERLFCCLDSLTHFPVVVTAFNVQFSQKADSFHRASIIQRINGFLNNLLVLTLIQLTFFAATNKEDAFRKHVWHMVQQQCLPRFSFQFAPT